MGVGKLGSMYGELTSISNMGSDRDLNLRSNDYQARTNPNHCTIPLYTKLQTIRINKTVEYSIAFHLHALSTINQAYATW